MTRCTAVLFAASLAVSALGVPVASAATDHLVAGATCAEPTPARDYDAQALTYRLAMDVSGCDWWDGSPIQLVADVGRLDGTREEGATSFVLCGGLALGERSEADAPTAAGAPAVGRATCEVAVGLDHPPVEAARYHGKISYPWEGATRTVTFEAVCVSAGPLADCHDLGGP
jgi:hypothetical protein